MGVSRLQGASVSDMRNCNKHIDCGCTHGWCHLCEVEEVRATVAQQEETIRELRADRAWKQGHIELEEEAVRLRGLLERAGKMVRLLARRDRLGGRGYGVEPLVSDIEAELGDDSPGDES